MNERTSRAGSFPDTHVPYSAIFSFMTPLLFFPFIARRLLLTQKQNQRPHSNGFVLREHIRARGWVVGGPVLPPDQNEPARWDRRGNRSFQREVWQRSVHVKST